MVLELTVDGARNAEGITMDIPKEILMKIAEGTEADLRINAGLATVAVSAEALDSIAVEARGAVSLEIHRADMTDLTEEARLRIGDRPVFDFSLKAGGSEITSFGGGTVQVSLPYTPDAAELANPEAIIVWYIDSSGELVSVPDGHYDSATGAVTFTVTHFSRYAVGYNQVNFSDVKDAAWYHDAVSFLAAREITAGTGSGNFSPNAKLTRGEFLVMLMKAYDIAPDANLSDNFSDAGSTYYTGYLAAAKRLGISDGVGDNLFAPGRQITRQELFTLTYNALKAIERLPEASGDSSGDPLSSFGDAGIIASWAKEAMSLMAEAGIVSGSGGILAPAETTTRAQLAQVIYNLLSE